MPSAMALERGDAYNQGSELVIQWSPTGGLNTEPPDYWTPQQVLPLHL